MSEHQQLSIAELTERFYAVREQRNKLLWACQKALDAFDAATRDGKATWSGVAVDEMRMAVAATRAIYQPTGTPPSNVALEIAARVWCDQEMRNCVMDGAAAEEIAAIIDRVRCGQAGEDGRWVCTESEKP